MDEADRKFYVMWGIVLVLIGIAAALAIGGYGAYGVLAFFVGIGIALTTVSEGDNTKFYGGMAFIMVGFLLYALMTPTSVAYAIILMVILIGALVALYGLRGGKV